jgi:cytosine/adenosine deaminase-related metal-dependent hydrolase
LLSAVHDRSAQLGVPFAIHVAESSAETSLLLDGTGPLAGTAARTAFGFEPPGVSTVAYLASLGALEGATAVHLCHLAEDEIGLLALAVRGAVTCPRSNEYLSNPVPRITPLLEAGIPVGIGTDSSASNYDLDLLSEVRALRAAEPQLSADELLGIATLGGARDRRGPRLQDLEPGSSPTLRCSPSISITTRRRSSSNSVDARPCRPS